MAEVGGYISLADAKLLTQSELLAGVVPTIVVTGGLAPQLPIRIISGTSLLYNRESAIPTGDFKEIAEEWQATEDLDLTQVETALKTYADQKNLDQFAQHNYSNINDLMVVLTKETVKGLMRSFEGEVFYHATFGLHSLVTSGQTVNSGSSATGAAAAAGDIMSMIDKVLLGSPSQMCLPMPRQLALRIDQANLGGGSTWPVMMITPGTTEAGGLRLAPVAKSFREVEIVRNNQMTMTETISSSTYSAKTGGATGSIFCVYKGQPEEGGVFMGAGAGTSKDLFEVTEPQESEHGNHKFFKTKAYLAVGMGSPLGLSRLDGNTDAAIVAA